MLTVRPTLMLAKKLRLNLPADPVPVTEPHTDWCVHRFTAQRRWYLIFTNTHSLLSFVISAKGITSDQALIRAFLSSVQDFLRSTGRPFTYERFLAPHSDTVQWARIPNRRVMGSMNELIWNATVDLVEVGLSPAEVSQRLIHTPMFMLGSQGSLGMPAQTFDHMPARL